MDEIYAEEFRDTGWFSPLLTDAGWFAMDMVAGKSLHELWGVAA